MIQNLPLIFVADLDFADFRFVVFPQTIYGLNFIRVQRRQVEFQTRAIFGPMLNDLAFEEDDRIF